VLPFQFFSSLFFPFLFPFLLALPQEAEQGTNLEQYVTERSTSAKQLRIASHVLVWRGARDEIISATSSIFLSNHGVHADRRVRSVQGARSSV
jgi:hypothetical protein